MSENNEKNLKNAELSFFRVIKDNIETLKWIIPLIITITISFLQFVWYVLESGKLSYWQIESSAISIISGGTIYSILMYLAFGIIIAFSTYIPFIIFSSKLKTVTKVFAVIGLRIAFAVVLFVIINGFKYFEYGILAAVIAWYLASEIWFIIFFSPSALLAIILSSLKDKKKKFFKNAVSTIVIIFFLVIIVLSYGIGYFTASNQRNFRITEDGYAIIYETSDNYYLAEYNVEKNVINKDRQKIINKEDITYTWINIGV